MARIIYYLISLLTLLPTCFCSQDPDASDAMALLLRIRGELATDQTTVTSRTEESRVTMAQFCVGGRSHFAERIRCLSPDQLGSRRSPSSLSMQHDDLTPVHQTSLTQRSPSPASGTPHRANSSQEYDQDMVLTQELLEKCPESLHEKLCGNYYREVMSCNRLRKVWSITYSSLCSNKESNDLRIIFTNDNDGHGIDTVNDDDRIIDISMNNSIILCDILTALKLNETIGLSRFNELISSASDECKIMQSHQNPREYLYIITSYCLNNACLCLHVVNHNGCYVIESVTYKIFSIATNPQHYNDVSKTHCFAGRS